METPSRHRAEAPGVCGYELTGSASSRLHHSRPTSEPRDPGSKGPPHPNRGPSEPGGPNPTKQLPGTFEIDSNFDKVYKNIDTRF